MSTHSPAYLLRRRIVRALFWTPVTLAGGWLMLSGFIGALAA